MSLLTVLPTPITDALSTDPAIDRRDVPARVWREMAELERDCMTLALRMYGLDTDTFAPETAEVIDRWRPRVRALLEESEK